jgi:hypothetical protein
MHPDGSGGSIMTQLSEEGGTSFKPSLAFLRKVGRGEVKRVRGYTARRGGYDRFIGGEKQWEKHYRAGYVSRAPLALMGQPGVVALTELGRAAIAAYEAKGDIPLDEG